MIPAARDPIRSLQFIIQIHEFRGFVTSADEVRRGWMVLSEFR